MSVRRRTVYGRPNGRFITPTAEYQTRDVVGFTEWPVDKLECPACELGTVHTSTMSRLYHSH